MRQNGEIIRGLAVLLSVFLLLCISIYALDMLQGDGDGIVYKYDFNPLLAALSAVVLCVPLIGVLTSSRRLSNISLVLLTSLLAVGLAELSLRFIMKDKNQSQTKVESNFYDVKKWKLTSLMRDTSGWDKKLSDRANLTFSYISGMKEDVENYGSTFHMVLIAYPWQFIGENQYSRNFYEIGDFVFPRSGLEQRISEFAEKEDISFLSLYDAFLAQKKSNDTEKLYYNYDGHWNEKRHQIAAKTVYHFLEKNKDK